MRLSGLIILFAMLLIAIGHFVIFSIYANVNNNFKFQKINSKWLWIFIVASGFYLIRLAHISKTWKSSTEKFIKEKYKLNQNNLVTEDSETTQTGPRHRSCVSLVGLSVKKVQKYYDDNFDINGKYYFHILYSGEFAECCIQFSNLIVVYACTLPLAWNIVFAIVLISESYFRAKIMYRKVWGTDSIINYDERNFQVILDVTIDIFFLVVPLAIIYYGYSLKMSIVEILRIVLMPTMTLFTKLPTIIDQIVLNHVIEDISSQQDKISKKHKRKRKSIFGASVNENVVDIQNKYFPRCAKSVVFGLSFIYAVSILVLLILQLANLSIYNSCNTKLGNIWVNGCTVKIPYCKRAFHPKCNCASLYIEGDKTLTTLPTDIVYDMDGLRSFHINDCNLTKLPENMENLVEMNNFDVSFNKLIEFNIDIGKWKKLVRLFLSFNRISKYNQEALWTHSNLVNLAINDNVGMKMPVDIEMPFLNFLMLSNNSVSVNSNIFNKENLPGLIFLFLNGNNLINFPDKSLKAELLQLGIARCNVTDLPLYLSEFTKLRYLDARNNNISVVNNKFKSLIKRNRIEAYFSGNKACKLDKELDCEPLCSKYCWSRNNAKNNNYCDKDCNSKECKYDNGECLQK
eukprot:g3507.t1